MILLKTININNLENSVTIENGIKCALVDKKMIVLDNFWGKSKVNLGSFAELDKMEKKNNNVKLLSYISKLIPNDIDDGYKELEFNISTYQPEKLEGYLVFIKFSSNEIKCSGEKIFGRYPNEGIYLLKENDILEFNNKKFKVNNKELLMIV